MSDDLGRIGHPGGGWAPMWMGRFNTRIEQADGCAVVHVAGDIDLTTAEMLRVHVITAALSVTPPRVVLDMNNVTHCDSTGLGALIAIYRAIKADSGGLVLARPPASCREILKRTGLDRHFTISDSLEHAVTLHRPQHCPDGPPARRAQAPADPGDPASGAT